MNKVLLTALAVVTAIMVALFFMLRSANTKNAQLCEENSSLTARIEMMQKTLTEKESVITEQNKKYNEIMESIKYNDCENLPVSADLLNAAKELQK